MAGRPKLKDVAALAGVSTSTVARVLHGNGYAGEETRRAVEAALEQTGYQINAVAQGLRRQRTSTVGHILHGIIPNPFFARVAAGVEQQALQHDMAVLMFNTDGEAARERLGVETLLRRRVDAMLFTVPVDEENVRLAVTAGIPVVQIERPTSISTDAVTVDNSRGGRAAVDHLVALGHRTIAYIGADPARRSEHTKAAPSVEQERLSGYLDSMREHGLAVREDQIALGDYYTKGRDQPTFHGYTAMKRFLGQGLRPTAVFAAADLMAAGALQAIQEEGLWVPRDISVIGFDDTYAAYLSPPLTTVVQPMVEMGSVAADLAVRALEPGNGRGADTPKVVRLGTSLQIRASTGPAMT